MNKFQPSRIIFYILSFSWGIILSALGLGATLALHALGYRQCPNQYGYVTYLGSNSWGGFTLGPFSFVEANASPELLRHEAGHSYQNIIFGPIMVILTLISIIHYWISCFVPSVNANYYNFWIEANATKLGWRMRSVIKNR